MHVCTHVRDIAAMRVVPKQFAHAYKLLSSSGSGMKLRKKICERKDTIKIRKKTIGDLPYTGCPNSKDT